MNTHVIVLSALFLLIDVVLHVLIQFATIAPTRPFAQGVFSTLTIRTVVPMLLSLLLNQIACRLKLNIVEEEQKYVATNQERDEISAGCRTQKCFVAVISASETPTLLLRV